MKTYSVSEALQGACSVGDSLQVKGWVRTRRDSKAGLSFINLHDGSSFDAIQVIAESNLPNYAAEIAKLTAGCAIEVIGTLVESPGKGQAYEIGCISF